MAKRQPRAGTLERYDRIVHAFYEAAIDGTQWPNALTELVQYIGNAGTHLFFTDATTGLIREDVYVGMPRVLMDDYNRRMVLNCPRVRAALAHPERTILYDYQHIDERGIDRSDYYDWLRTKGDGIRYYLALRFYTDRRTVSGISLAFRDREGHCQRDHIERLERLAPHIQRAARISQKFGSLTAVHQSYEQWSEQLDFALIALNDRLQPMYLNRLARQLVANGTCVTTSAQQLNLRDPEANESLQRLLRLSDDPRCPLVQQTGARLVTRGADSRHYRVSVSHIPAGTAFVGEERVRRVVTLTPLGKTNGRGLPRTLSPAERLLAQSLAQGKTVAQIAADRGISLHTARTQLKSALAKAGVHRQSQLVALALGTMTQCELP